MENIMTVKNTEDLFKVDREEMKETNDCVVRAIAVAYDTTYGKSHFYCRKYLNRHNRKGVYTTHEFDGKDRISRNTIPMTFKSGMLRWFTRNDVIDQSDHEDNGKSGMYVKKFIKNFPKGIYIVLSRGSRIHY
jgi:hypothetical protein